MFEENRRSNSQLPKWPIILSVVAVLLVAIQMLRVNKPVSAPSVEQLPTYTRSGPVMVGPITIAAGGFNSQKIDLNRKARLVGSFQTGSVQRRVSVLVLKEREIELWNSNSIYSPLAETGYVPGGKISPTLEPGGYFLVIDNRFNNEPMSVDVNFTLE